MLSAPDAASPNDTTVDAGFGVYLHWPFCLSKCPYCDFNSHVRERVDQARWRAALLAEIDATAAETSERTVTSIFFGGGTPSLMHPDTVAATIERIADRWNTGEDIEITLEANPTSVEAERFAAYKAAGINRVSLGVQSLDDTALAFLGRGHSAAEALAAVALAQRHFERVSFDLIYGRPEQRVAAWRAELAQALSVAGEHLSLYQLTIEPGTAFYTLHQRGDLATPEEGLAAALYEETQSITADAGLPAYEISNHARPGAASRHNLTYWQYGEYAGIGPGAHSRVIQDGARVAVRRRRAPDSWLAAVETSGHGTQERIRLQRGDAIDEMMMMGLRLVEGVDRDRLRSVAGEDFEAVLDRKRLADLAEGGFIELDADALRATAAGRLRLNAVLAELLA